jgi:hypothetical protein
MHQSGKQKKKKLFRNFINKTKKGIFSDIFSNLKKIETFYFYSFSFGFENKKIKKKEFEFLD